MHVFSPAVFWQKLIVNVSSGNTCKYRRRATSDSAVAEDVAGHVGSLRWLKLNGNVVSGSIRPNLQIKGHLEQSKTKSKNPVKHFGCCSFSCKMPQIDVLPAKSEVIENSATHVHWAAVFALPFARYRTRASRASEPQRSLRISNLLDSLELHRLGALLCDFAAAFTLQMAKTPSPNLCKAETSIAVNAKFVRPLLTSDAPVAYCATGHWPCRALPFVQ